MQFGFDDGSRKIISELRIPQKIEWFVHPDLPFRTAEIPVFGEKEVLQLLPDSGSKKARK